MGFGCLGAFAVDFRTLQPRLDHLVGDDPADDNHEHARQAGEQPVAERIDDPLRVENLRGRLRETLQQRIDPRRYEVGAKSARDARESAGNSRQRMTSSGVEDHASQRNHQNISRVRRRVADNRHQQKHRRQQAFRRERDETLQAGIDEPGVFRNAYTKQRYENHSKRCEPGKGRHHVGEKRRQACAR